MYKYHYILVSFFLIAYNTSAQEASIAEIYASFIDSTDLKRKVYTLADDSFLGRETTKEGQKIAEEFIVSEFKKLSISEGNNGSYLQEYSVINRAFNTIQFQIGDKLIDSSKEMFTINSNKDLSLSANSMVFAGYGITTDNYNDYENLSVEDKVVFIFDGTPKDEEGIAILEDKENNKWNRYSSLKEELAFKNGAIAIVFVLEDFEITYRKFEKYLSRGGVSLFDPENDLLADFPSIIMKDSSFYDLFNINKSYCIKNQRNKEVGKKAKEMVLKKKVSIDIECNKTVSTSSNVLAKITAKDSLAPWLVLSAHYDHEGIDSSVVYNGADDNASGTSAVLEIAKVFKKASDNGAIYEKNILFLLVSGEEKGLLGSKYYTTNPVVDLQNTIVNLNIDMIGRVDKKHQGNANYVYVIGADKISQELHDINESMNTAYTKLELDYTYNLETDPNRYYYRSDHYNFAKNGIPVIFYFNGTHEDYHKPTDTADKIVYSALYYRTQLVFHTAWYIAMMKSLLN